LLTPERVWSIVLSMKLSERIRRWWNPGKRRDEHPEISDGDGFALSAEQRLTDNVGKGGSNELATDTRTITPTDVG
jgi:hypothetical protein